MAEIPDADAEFKQWLADVYGRLAAAVRRLGVPPGEAQDILHDSLIALIERRGRITSYDMLLHYGLNLVRWRSSDAWRRRRREEPVGGLAEMERLGLGPRSGHVPNPEILVAAQDDLHQQLSSLSPRLREVMELAMTGRTSVEIAQQLGIEPATVRSLIRRARFQLATSQGASP